MGNHWIDICFEVMISERVKILEEYLDQVKYPTKVGSWSQHLGMQMGHHKVRHGEPFSKTEAMQNGTDSQ